MSTKDLAKDLEETVDEGDFLEFDTSGSRKDSGNLDGYKILHKINLRDPAITQVVFKYKSRTSV
jgi:hypothetical protein